MFVEDKNDARQFFFQVWDKMSQQVGLEPLELVISDVIKTHPEYHEVLRSKDLEFSVGSSDDDGAKNPFLHMGLHIALIEQLQTQLFVAVFCTHDLQFMNINMLEQCFFGH